MAKKKKSNRTLYIILGVVALLIIVAVARPSSRGNATEVTVAQVKKGKIVEKVSASGAVQPVIEVKISPEVAGEIIELEIEEGDSVNNGDFLLKIRPDNFQSAYDRAVASLNQQRANLKSAESSLARAEASLLRAKQDYDRNKKLWSERVISEADWQTAESNYEIAVQDKKAAEQSVEAARYILRSSEATVDEAKENLDLTEITAPMSGIVSKLDVEAGETVVGTSQMQGTEMLRIADLSKMEVRVDVNENDIIRVSVGDEVEIDVDSYSHLDKKFKGKVTQIANSANDKISADAVTEFEVRILILASSYQDLIKDGNRYPFRPGMTASVDIITESKEGILTVPLSSVTTREPVKEEGKEGDKSDKDEDEEMDEVVFVVEGEVVKQTKVKTGISDFDNIEILDGVQEGAEVVSAPFIEVSKRLKNDEKVEVTEGREDKKGDEEEEAEE